MKKEKTNALWYNDHGKETGCIILEGREDVLRRASPYPDPRAGLRMTAVVCDCFQAIIP